jgi:hypothetical protein
MDDQDLRNVKIPVWVIIVMVVSTVMSLGFLLVMLQRDFELDKILYFFLSIILLIVIATIFYFIKKIFKRMFRRNRRDQKTGEKSRHFVEQEDDFDDKTSEVNQVTVEPTFISEDNGVKLAQKEKTDEYLGGNNRSDIFRY